MYLIICALTGAFAGWFFGLEGVLIAAVGLLLLRPLLGYTYLWRIRRRVKALCAVEGMPDLSAVVIPETLHTIVSANGNKLLPPMVAAGIIVHATNQGALHV